MSNQIETTKVVTYFQNGNEDDAKFVEVDGVKYQPDDADPTKPKMGDDDKPIPFKEEAPAETPEEKKVREAAEAEAAKGNKTLEELAKDNPAIQKMLDEKNQLEADKKKADADAAKAAEEAAEKKGEWKTLAETRKAEADKLTAELAQKEEILGKYVNSTKAILKDVMATIPEENRGLIPDNFSPREKLEYISKNAKVLGAKVGKTGGGVNPNDGDPAPTEEAKLVTDIEDLRKKENKTQADHTKIFELSKKLKEVRAAQQGK